MRGNVKNMENASFENKMQDLEKIVKDLEKGDLSLEEHGFLYNVLRLFGI